MTKPDNIDLILQLIWIFVSFDKDFQLANMSVDEAYVARMGNWDRLSM